LYFASEKSRPVSVTICPVLTFFFYTLSQNRAADDNRRKREELDRKDRMLLGGSP